MADITLTDSDHAQIADKLAGNPDFLKGVARRPETEETLNGLLHTFRQKIVEDQRNMTFEEKVLHLLGALDDPEVRKRIVSSIDDSKFVRELLETVKVVLQQTQRDTIQNTSDTVERMLETRLAVLDETRGGLVETGRTLVATLHGLDQTVAGLDKGVAESLNQIDAATSKLDAAADKLTAAAAREPTPVTAAAAVSEPETAPTSSSPDKPPTMRENMGNPAWLKQNATALVAALFFVIALVQGLVMLSWTGSDIARVDRPAQVTAADQLARTASALEAFEGRMTKDLPPGMALKASYDLVGMMTSREANAFACSQYMTDRDNGMTDAALRKRYGPTLYDSMVLSPQSGGLGCTERFGQVQQDLIRLRR